MGPRPGRGYELFRVRKDMREVAHKSAEISRGEALLREILREDGLAHHSPLRDLPGGGERDTYEEALSRGSH